LAPFLCRRSNGVGRWSTDECHASLTHRRLDGGEVSRGPGRREPAPPVRADPTCEAQAVVSPRLRRAARHSRRRRAATG
jgi:hypothetical protein